MIEKSPLQIAISNGMKTYWKNKKTAKQNGASSGSSVCSVLSSPDSALASTLTDGDDA